jgi:hypothetical protein
MIDRDQGLVYFGEEHEEFYSQPFKKNGKTYYHAIGTDGSKVKWRAAMEPYWKFCRKRGLSPNVLLELAKREVEKEKFLQPELYRMKQEFPNPHQRWRMRILKGQVTSITRQDEEEASNILVDNMGLATMLSYIYRSLDTVERPKKKGGKKVLINDLRWLSAYVEGLMKQPEDVKRIRGELTDTIDDIIDRTNRG